jgi:hypothetical protein
MKNGFEVFETIGIGIPNPRSVTRITGPPEKMERLIAFLLQSGEEVSGITEEERQRYLAMEIDT